MINNKDTLYQRLGIEEKQLTEFCQQEKITELCLFGSILREDFNPKSDIDILVTFEPNINISLLQFVDLEYKLQDLLKRDVDLILKTKNIPIKA